MNGQQYQKLAIEADPSKFLGVPYLESTFKGTNSANPVNMAYWAIVGSATGNFVGTINMQVRIIYDAVFLDPFPPSVS